jgi:hypothetical protein
MGMILQHFVNGTSQEGSVCMLIDIIEIKLVFTNPMKQPPFDLLKSSIALLQVILLTNHLDYEVICIKSSPSVRVLCNSIKED